jgi:class 3 adenylate cyclase/CHASE2 domain-containing sensor protein
MKLRRLISFVVIVASSTGATLLAEKYGSVTGVESAEQAFLGLRQTAAAESRVGDAGGSSDVVLVLFDSMSVAEWPYQSPFPRPFLAELIDALSDAGVRTIGLDVFLDRTYPGLNAMDQGDDLLRAAIERAGNVVLVSRVVTTPGGPVLERPDPFFADVAAEIAAAELPTPFETVQDGVLAVRSGGRLEPSIALALWAQARGVDVDSLLAAAKQTGRVELPGLPAAYADLPEGFLTTWRAGQGYALTFPLRFIGPPSVAEMQEGRANTFETFSGGLAAVTASFLPDAFKDRVVMLGTGFHDSDKFRTPYYLQSPEVPEGSPAAPTYAWMYGVEVHANALQNMLDGAYIRPIPTWAKVMMLLLLAAIAAAVPFKSEAGTGALGAIFLALGVTGASFWAYAGQVFLPGGRVLMQLGAPYLVVPITVSIVVIVFSYLGSIAYVSVVEGRDKRFIKSAFGKYVSPAVVDEIADHPEALKLGGAKFELSILFSDLAGFTDLSEKLDPQELITLINEYLSEMTDLVMVEQGTLDKYIGDAIMAFWNAPRPAVDHADRALRCAILMQRKMNELNARWRQLDPTAEPLSVRIGINTGTVVVGNVGGKDRFDYSALGDAVNLAARLEPANKTYETLVMAAENTMRAANRAAYRYRELDLLAVKGKLQPVTVYEIVEMADAPLPEHREECLRHYDSGLVAYKRRDWELAMTYFEAALAADPQDGPTALYLERCRENIAHPPPADWDFVVRRTTK